jgi:hypothetical protein
MGMTQVTGTCLTPISKHEVIAQALSLALDVSS